MTYNDLPFFQLSTSEFNPVPNPLFPLASSAFWNKTPNHENYKICIFFNFNRTKCWIPEGDKGDRGPESSGWRRVVRMKGVGLKTKHGENGEGWNKRVKSRSGHGIKTEIKDKGNEINVGKRGVLRWLLDGYGSPTPSAYTNCRLSSFSPVTLTIFITQLNLNLYVYKITNSLAIST